MKTATASKRVESKHRRNRGPANVIFAEMLASERREISAVMRAVPVWNVAIKCQ